MENFCPPQKKLCGGYFCWAVAKIILHFAFCILNYFITLRYEKISCTFEDLGAEVTKLYLARILGTFGGIVYPLVYLKAELHLHHRL